MRLRVLVEPDAHVEVIEAEIHHAGCMKARYTHIDMPAAGRAAGLLAELARGRGVRLPCRSDGGRLVIHVPGLGVDLVLEAPGLPACREYVHVSLHHGHLVVHPW